MRAAIYTSTGSARDVLRVEEVERPEPGPGEVLVRVHASGVNPTDYKTRSGITARPIDGFQIPHQDGAGVIEAVGAGVDQARLGERVWIWLAAFGQCWGTAAEWTVVPSRRAVPLPDIDQVKAFSPVVDRVVEVALGANLELDLAVSGLSTTVVTYAAEAHNPALPVRACMAANMTLRFVLLYGVPDDALDAAVTDVTDSLRSGALTELPAHRFPLSEVVRAHEAAEGGAVGKVVVTPA
jgi:NADPH:quinone reductase-like Zn-dependent oxidoreductase